MRQCLGRSVEAEIIRLEERKQLTSRGVKESTKDTLEILIQPLFNALRAQSTLSKLPETLKNLDTILLRRYWRGPPHQTKSVCLVRPASDKCNCRKSDDAHRNRRCRGPAGAGEHSGAMTRPSRARPCRWRATRCTRQVSSGRR